MADLGVSGYTAAPPAWRLLSHMGVELPPPLFVRFWPHAVAVGASFALLFGLVTFLASVVAPVSFSWLSSMGAGIVFGLVFAAVTRARAIHHNLPLWSEYKGQSREA